MDGPSLVQQQLRNGVRLLVQEIDQLRLEYGISSVRVLTPKAETCIRAGTKAKVPLKIEFMLISCLCVLQISIPMTYPEIPPEIALQARQSDDNDLTELQAQINARLEVLSQDDSEVRQGYLSPLIKYFIEVSSISDSGCKIALEEEKTSEAPLCYFACSKCRFYLFTSEDIHDHNNSGDDLCTSIFLNEPTEWMDDISEIEAKLLCPKCSNRVGSYCWAGLKCSCNSWITPGIKFLKSKVDLKHS